ncbi:MAG: hypothetical protein ABH817_02570 [archaeon]
MKEKKGEGIPLGTNTSRPLEEYDLETASLTDTLSLFCFNKPGELRTRYESRSAEAILWAIEICEAEILDRKPEEAITMGSGPVEVYALIPVKEYIGINYQTPHITQHYVLVRGENRKDTLLTLLVEAQEYRARAAISQSTANKKSSDQNCMDRSKPHFAAAS